MIVFQNVTFAYPGSDSNVLTNVNLHVPLRDFQFLTGASGVGKTTILKLLLKELEPQSGEIYLNGQPLSRIKKKEIPMYRRRIGVVSQNMGLLEEKTVYENVELVKRAVGADAGTIRVQVAMALKSVGMEEHYQKHPSELSGGQQQRVCIARAIVNHPELLVADEPTGNLDFGSSMEIMELLEGLHKQGMTLLVATHDTEVLHKYLYPQILVGEMINGENRYD